MILLIGATGSVGRHISARLAGQPDVRALVRSPASAAAVAAHHLVAVPGDLARPETLERAFAGVDRVVLVTPFSPDQAQLERAAIHAASAAGVRYVVKVAARDTAPGVDVAMTSVHREVERDLVASGIAHVTLMADWYASNYNEQVELIRGGVLSYPHPHALTAVVDVRDVADVAVACILDPSLAGPSAALTITGAETLSFRQIGEEIALRVGRPVELVEASIEDWHGGLVAFGVPDWQADALRELLDGYARRSGDQTDAALATLLGRPPRTFATYVRELLAPAVQARPSVS